MNISRHFKKLNIIPIYEISDRKKCEFANKLAILIVDTFSEYKFSYLKIVESLQRTKMYVAKVPKNISPVNYSYVDEVMYIAEEMKLDIKNEYVLHEAIHRIQENRNKKNKLMQLGICNVFDTKIQGLALNEAAIQYIVKKLLKRKQHIVEIYDIKIPTTSPQYFPMLTNLIEQIVFLLGDKLLIESTLNSTESFKYNAIDNFGEKNYFTIQANFDKILECKDRVLKGIEIQNNIDYIKNMYMETQNLIFMSYFDKLLKRIETSEELAEYKSKLISYRDYIGMLEERDFYTEYCRNQEKEIKELEYKLYNKALITTNNGKFLKFLKRIIDRLTKGVYNQF